MPCEPATPAPLGTASALPSEDAPRIYVACLAAYNNGYLHGRWINATTPDEIMDKVRAMLAASPLPDADEWAIHDYEGFEGASLSEYASFETVCALAEFISEHGRLGAKVHRHYGDDLEQARAASRTMRANTARLQTLLKSWPASAAPKSRLPSNTISIGTRWAGTWR